MLYLLLAVLVCTVFLGASPIRVEAYASNFSTFSVVDEQSKNAGYLSSVTVKAGCDLSLYKLDNLTDFDFYRGFERKSSEIKKMKSWKVRSKSTKWKYTTALEYAARYTSYIEYTVPLDYDYFPIVFTGERGFVKSIKWSITGDTDSVTYAKKNSFTEKGINGLYSQFDLYLKKKGTVTVTATVDGKKYTAKVKIVAAKKKIKTGFNYKTMTIHVYPDSLKKSVTISGAELVSGGKLGYYSEAIFNPGLTTNLPNIVWTVDDPSIVRFGVLGGLKKSYTKAALTAAQKNLIVNGLYLKNSYDTIKKKVSKYYDIPSIVALKEGTTYVRATLNGKTYKIKVTVKADLVDCNKADSVYHISTECE
jgi:hypothetical protein